MFDIESIPITTRCARMFRYGKMDTCAMAEKLGLPEHEIYGYLHIGLLKIPQPERIPRERSEQ